MLSNSALQKSLLQSSKTRFNVGLDFALILSSPVLSCFLFDIVWGQLAELKILTLNKRRRWFHSSRLKLPFRQYVCELVFGVNVFDLDLLVQVDCVKQPIKRNSVGSGNMSHCWTSASDNHLDHRFIIFKNAKQSASYDAIPHAWMDWRRTRRVRPTLFWSFEKYDQIASTWSFYPSIRWLNSWLQNSGTDVCITSRVFSALVNSNMAELFAKRRWSQDEISVLPGSSLCVTILFLRAIHGHSGENQIDPLLHDNVLLLSDFAEYIYHVGSSHDMHSIIQPGLILGGKDVKEGRQTVFFTWRSPELQCTNKIGKYTRTQCTRSIWELLRRRDWRSIKRDLSRSSFTALYQQRVLRRWWQWVQRSTVSQNVRISSVTAKSCAKTSWARRTNGDYTHERERASNAHSSKYRGDLSLCHRLSDSRTTTLYSWTRRPYTQRSSQKVDSSIRNAPKSRSVESRPEAKSRVQPIQRKVEGHDPQHGERGVLRNVWDISQNSVPSVCWRTGRQGSCIAHAEPACITQGDATNQPGSIWCIIDLTTREKEGSNSRRASWEHWETTNLSRSSRCGWKGKLKSDMTPYWIDFRIAPIYRESQIAIGWDEAFCVHYDEISTGRSYIRVHRRRA